MTPALVDYLVQFKDTRITVASNILKDAQEIANRHPLFIQASFLDIFNVSQKTLAIHIFNSY